MWSLKYLCLSVLSQDVVQLPHVPPSSLCGVAHLHQLITLMTQGLKINWGSLVRGTGLPKGFACSSTPARMLTPAGESLRWPGLGITPPYHNAALHLLTMAASWLVWSRRVWVHLHLFTHSLRRTSVLCLALLPSDLLVAARVIYEAVAFKV